MKYFAANIINVVVSRGLDTNKSSFSDGTLSISPANCRRRWYESTEWFHVSHLRNSRIFVGFVFVAYFWRVRPCLRIVDVAWNYVKGPIVANSQSLYKLVGLVLGGQVYSVWCVEIVLKSWWFLEEDTDRYRTRNKVWNWIQSLSARFVSSKG